MLLPRCFLLLALGAIQQQIEVQADAPVVDAERIQQATTIGLGRIRDLPINRRDYLDFALLSPATASTTDLVDGTDYRVAQTPQSGISFGGGNGRGNGFFIDGVENYINSGGVRQSVSQEAVQDENSQFGALVAYNRGRDFDTCDGTTMINDSLIPGSSWVVETRAMFNFNHLAVSTVDPYGPEMNVTGFGFFGREIFLPSRTDKRHYQVMQNWSHHSSAHDTKFGFDINPVRDLANTETFFSGRFSFGEVVPLQNIIAGTAGTAAVARIAGYLQTSGQASLVPTLSQPVSALRSLSLGLPTFYQQGFGNPIWIGWSKRFGFFAQDSWRLTRSFTLS